MIQGKLADLCATLARLRFYGHTVFVHVNPVDEVRTEEAITLMGSAASVHTRDWDAEAIREGEFELVGITQTEFDRLPMGGR